MGAEGVGARRGGGPEGWGPGPKFRAFFVSPARNFILSSLSGGSSRGIVAAVQGMPHPKCGFLLVSFCVNTGGRQAPTGTNRHQQAPTSTNKHQQAKSGNNKEKQKQQQQKIWPKH